MPRTFIESTDPSDPADQPVDYCLSCWNDLLDASALHGIGIGESSHPDYEDCDQLKYACVNCEDVLTSDDN